MDLVIHHVFEALVVSGAEEDLRGQLATRETVIQHLRERRQHGVGANKKPLVRITHQKKTQKVRRQCAILDQTYYTLDVSCLPRFL